MLELYQRIANAATTLNGSLAFANEWNFFTGDPTTDFDNLVSTGPHAGTSTAFNTGVELRTMYKHLLDSAPVEGRTVLWASDSGLVIATAQYLSAGFFGLDWEASADLHVVSEAPDLGADSLTPGKTCFNHADGAYDDGYRDVAIGISQFKHSYLGTIRESMSKENSDFPLSLDEIYTMQEICGFETIALGRSKWCDVFDNEEWASFEYARDLLHFYQSGPGNPYGATMGWPWLNATANLLLDGPDKGSLFFSLWVECHLKYSSLPPLTQSSVHDASVVSLLAALDLLPQTPHLPTSHIMTNRTWRMSDVVPMGGRIIFERLACPATQRCWTNAPLYPNHIYCEPIRIDHFVRINVNDAIIAVPGCDAGPGGSCELSSFLEMVARRGVEVGDFAEVCGLPGDAARAITFLHQ